MSEEVQRGEAEQTRNLPPQVEPDVQTEALKASAQLSQMQGQSQGEGVPEDEHPLRNAVVIYRVVGDDGENVLSEHESRAEATREAEMQRRQGIRARVRIAALRGGGQ